MKHDVALDVACARLTLAINRASAVKRTCDVYRSARKPVYIDGVIIHETKRRKV